MVNNDMVPRQIWASPRPTPTRSSMAGSQLTSTLASQVLSAMCTVALPARGVLYFNDTYSTVLSDSITFESDCSDPVHAIANHNSSDFQTGNSTVVKFDDPFYASVAPQIYALATATMVSYILVILIFITPRTFYVGGLSGGAGFLGLRSLVPGAGSSSVIGVGRRPLLQKIATITVAVSLTIATADTFRVAEQQYGDGLMDSQKLVEQVIGSTEIRVIRVVSDTFLWLAQVQTLIRLFPRHKEKVTIKWLGFALVTCDTVFSILENFMSGATLTRPRSFQDAIPALSYLFQMAISLIYASCVIYYSLSKRRFAFWHSKMRNILLVAILSLTSVLIPVVFFVLDVSQPNIATWGEYIRWVGAAAASVVVWEWVERIESLERDEKKDGILGREVFDGDEMLHMGSDSKSNSTSTYFSFGKRSNTSGEKKVSMMPIPMMRPRVPFRRKKPEDKPEGRRASRRDTNHPGVLATNGGVTRPPQAITPVSRSDTTSAASTVYAVRYQNVSSPSPAIPEEPADYGSRSRHPSMQIDAHPVVPEELETPTRAHHPNLTQPATIDPSHSDDEGTERDDLRNRKVWQSVANPFKRKRAEPPAEVAAQMASLNARRSPAAEKYHNLRDRIHAFQVAQRQRLHGKQRVGPSPPMPVTVIPAQPRPSRLTVPGKTFRTSRDPSVNTQQQDRKSSSSCSRRDSLPVTVIPAPVRGGRTWSPDDLEDSHASSSSQQHLATTSSNDRVNPPSPPKTTATPPSQQKEFHVIRGALTIADSPSRLREQDNRSSSATARNIVRLRAPIVDSLDGRLSSSASPASVADHPSGSGHRQSPASVGIDTPNTDTARSRTDHDRIGEEDEQDSY